MSPFRKGVPAYIKDVPVSEVHPWTGGRRGYGWDKKGSKENRWEKEGSTAYRDGKGIHRGGLRGGSGKAETAAYAGRTGAFRETDGRTGSTDGSCITEDRLCGIPAKHKRNRSCDAGGMSGGTWQSGKIWEPTPDEPYGRL